MNTGTATNTLRENSEYDFVVDLFSTSTASSTTLIDRLNEELPLFTTPVATSSENSPATSTTIFGLVERGNMHLVDRGDELFAVWVGSMNDTPHYFCVSAAGSSSIAVRYGQHVADQVAEERLSQSLIRYL